MSFEISSWCVEHQKGAVCYAVWITNKYDGVQYGAGISSVGV